MRRLVPYLALAVSLGLAASPAAAHDDDDSEPNSEYHFDEHEWGDEDENVERTLEVERGQRLEVHNFNGDIRVVAGRGNRLVVKAETSGGTKLEVRRRGRTVHVQGQGRHGPPTLDLLIEAPSWMPVEIHGVNTDVVARGFDAELRVTTVNGDVVAEGGRGRIDLSSVNGEVMSKGARGRISLRSVNDDVSAFEATGTLRAETIDGDVVVRGVAADTVVATTVDGDIVFQGEIRRRGRYRFDSHDGDVVVILPRDVDATVQVASYDGSVSSDFAEGRRPRNRRGYGGRRYEFELGSGSARIEINTFDGDISIQRNTSGGGR